MKNEFCLIDTSAWIEFFRPDGIHKIRTHVTSLIATDLALTTAIIKAEIRQGARTEKEYNLLDRRLAAIRYRSFPEDLWNEVSRTAFQVRRKGYTVPVTDIMIAALALREDASVLHADKHFDKLSGVTGLRVISYVSELRRKRT